MINLAPNLKFDPVRATCETFAFVARRGAGKTYAAGLLVEEMMQEGSQVVVLDPVGVWYGLRLTKSGKQNSNFDIPVFGGEHGDIPLASDKGALIADVIVDRGISAVLDVTDFSKKERQRFVADFAERLFRRKKTARSPIHIVFEEAQVFAPQRVTPDKARMLGAVEDVVRLGRNYGIGATLISQRPQSVNKEVLNQVEVLCALQITGPHERKAIKEWAANNADSDQYKDIDAVLPSLEIGHAIVWSPQWLRCFKKVKFNKKKTYDASATPSFDEKPVKPQPLAPSEIQELMDAMQTVVDKADASDPRKLQARIRELEKELREQPKQPLVAPFMSPALQEISDEFEVLHTELADFHMKLDKTRAKAIHLLNRVKTGVIEHAVDKESKKTYGVKETLPTIKRGPERIEVVPVGLGSNGYTLKKGARVMLRCLAQRSPLNHHQLAMLAGIKATGSTFSSYLSILRKNGLVTESGKDISISDTGDAVVGIVPPASTAEEIRAMWRPRFKKGARAMLDALVGSPSGLTRTQLSGIVGISLDGSTFSSYLSTLRRSGVIEDDGHLIRPREEFV